MQSSIHSRRSNDSIHRLIVCRHTTCSVAGSTKGIHHHDNSSSSSSSSSSTSSSNSTHSDLSQLQGITEHLLYTAGEDVAYIEQSISNIARLLESPLGLKDGMDAAFEWLLQRPDALIDRSSNEEEETLAVKGSVEGPHPRTTTTQVIEDEYAFSLMDIASSTALGAGAVGKEIIDSPGTVRIISALRGRGLVSPPDLMSGIDPTEEALSGRDPVNGREEEETRPQRSVVFRSMLEERNPMLEQLQR